MLNNHQKNQLMVLSHSIKDKHIVGKDGLSPTVIADINNALEAVELIKVYALKGTSDEMRELGKEIEKKTSSEVIRIVGKSILLYRKSKTKQVITLVK